MLCLQSPFIFFFFNDTATTEIYTLSLHDALPILWSLYWSIHTRGKNSYESTTENANQNLERRNYYFHTRLRSEEHTSELQSRSDLVCRLLLEKKKKTKTNIQLNDTSTQYIYTCST